MEQKKYELKNQLSNDVTDKIEQLENKLSELRDTERMMVRESGKIAERIENQKRLKKQRIELETQCKKMKAKNAYRQYVQYMF